MNELNDKMQNEKADSYFDGDAVTSVLLSILSKAVRLITLDIAAPFVICMRMRWRAEHTYLSGRGLIFDGKGKDLFLKNLIWLFLSVITLGIFIPFRTLRLLKWELKYTHFIGVPNDNDYDNNSEFTGSWYSVLGINILKILATVLTLGICYFWAYNYKERWMTAHKVIDGHSLRYNGKASEYFKKCVKWTLLTVVTLGIFALCINGKILRMTIKNTSVETPNAIPFDGESARRQTSIS